MATKNKRKKSGKPNRFSSVAIILILLVFAGVVAVQSHGLNKREADYAKQEQVLQAQLEDARAQNEELKQQEIYVQTRQYIESIARQKFGLVNPDEMLITPNE